MRNPNQIEVTEYADGFKMRYHNARAIIEILENEEFWIEFAIASTDLKPRSIHKVTRGKVVHTGLKLSKHGAAALMRGLLLALEKQFKKVPQNGTAESAPKKKSEA